MSKQQRYRGQAMHPDQVRRIQELRRSSAASGKMVRTTRSAEKRRAIRDASY